MYFILAYLRTQEAILEYKYTYIYFILAYLRTYEAILEYQGHLITYPWTFNRTGHMKTKGSILIQHDVND